MQYYQSHILSTMTWHALTQANVNLVPSTSGVYFLGLGNNTLYIGSSVDLRQRLTEHNNSSDPCISKAQQFAIEPCADYRERERRHLIAYKAKHGGLPACNDRI